MEPNAYIITGAPYLPQGHSTTLETPSGTTCLLAAEVYSSTGLAPNFCYTASRKASDNGKVHQLKDIRRDLQDQARGLPILVPCFQQWLARLFEYVHKQPSESNNQRGVHPIMPCKPLLLTVFFPPASLEAPPLVTMSLCPAAAIFPNQVLQEIYWALNCGQFAPV